MFSGKTREGSTLLRDHNSGRNIHGALHRKVCWWLQKREKKEFWTILMRQVGSFTLTPTGDTDRCRVLCEKITLAREKSSRWTFVARKLFRRQYISSSAGYHSWGWARNRLFVDSLKEKKWWRKLPSSLCSSIIVWLKSPTYAQEHGHINIYMNIYISIYRYRYIIYIYLYIYIHLGPPNRVPLRQPCGAPCCVSLLFLLTNPSQLAAREASGWPQLKTPLVM